MIRHAARILSSILTAAALALVLACATAAWAFQQTEPAPASTNPPAGEKPAGASDAAAGAKRPIVVTVLSFAAETGDGAALGKQLSEIVFNKLDGTDGFRLVDRELLREVMEEQKINLTAAVKPKDALRIGQLVGAKLIVTGKAFALDERLFISAKIIGTETTLAEGVVVKGEKGANFADLADELAIKLQARLVKAGSTLIAADDGPADPVPALKAKLDKLRKPIIAVRIGERHVGRNPPAPGEAPVPPAVGGADPAAETEVRKVLRAAGFTIVEGSDREWVEGGVELVVTGEAFSEFAAQIGSLVSCSARAEVTVKDRKTGTVVFVERETARAADLSVNIAAKNALQDAGRTIGVRLLEQFAASLKPADKP